MIARAALLLLALAAAGCAGHDADRAELLKARAAKQDAEWIAMERQDQIEALEIRYRDLVAEFSDYQATACKRGAR